MQTQKMSLANIKGKLSRDEMKKIMAGSGDVDVCMNRGYSCVVTKCCDGLICAGSGDVKACAVY